MYRKKLFMLYIIVYEQWIYAKEKFQKEYTIKIG